MSQPKIPKSLLAKLESAHEKYKKPELEVEFISSGSIIIDAVISNGKGLPRGKMIEIHSESGIGKSTIILQACKKACELGHVCIYLDVEDGANDDQLESIGLLQYKGTLFHVFPIETYDEAEEIISMFDGEDLAYIVIDSISSLLPDDLKDRKVSEIQPGVKARYDSLFLQKYKGYLKRNVCTIILINQMRTKLNFKGMSSAKAAGGKAIEFYPDVRIKMRKISDMTKKKKTISGEAEVKYGAEVAFSTIKNRYNAPFIEGNIAIIFGKGVSNLSAFLTWLQASGCVKRSGSWYTITVGDLEGKVCGANGMLGFVKENAGVIQEYIANHGGFVLVETDDAYKEDSEGDGE